MHPDALIIGAGINGLLSALALRHEGLSVTVVDQGNIARESTWAGAGILSPLLPWDYGDEVNALTERGRALWPGLAKTLSQESGVDPEYWPCGMLAMGDFDVDQALAWCRDHDWSCTSAAPTRLNQTAQDTSVLWLPQVAQARNPRVAKALEITCRKFGVDLLSHVGVSSFDSGNGRILAATTHQGKLHADRYIVCSGAWSSKLLGDAALAMKITPIRGQILLFKSTTGVPAHIIYRHGKYIVPRLDGHILVGSTLEETGFDKSCTSAAKSELLDFALDTLPSLKDAELVHHWAGLRPGSPGNLPTISGHPDLDNLFVNSGHYRYAKPYEWRR